LLPTSTPYFFIYLCAHFPRGNGSRGTRFCSVESFMLPLLDTSSASERAPPPPRTVSKKNTKHGAWTIRMCVNHSHAHARSVVRFTIFAAPVCLYYSSTGFEEGAVGLLRRCHRRWPRVLLEVLRRAHTVPSIVTSCSCTQKTASGSRAQKLCSSVERARERARASERERETRTSIRRRRASRGGGKSCASLAISTNGNSSQIKSPVNLADTCPSSGKTSSRTCTRRQRTWCVWEGEGKKANKKEEREQSDGVGEARDEA